MRALSRAVFDVETKTVGDPYEIEMTSLSIIHTDDGIRRFYTGDDDTLREGVEQLIKADGLVGFNSLRFDVPVILKYMSRGEGRIIRNKPHFDFLAEMMNQWPGQRAGLANFSRTTLGEDLQKFELTNETAISLWRTNPDKLEAYNNWDTGVTYLLWLYMLEHGYVKFKLPVVRRLYPKTFDTNIQQ